jgi:hypothetical protein
MRLSILLSVVLSLAAAGGASAQTYTWNGGAGNGNWNAAANWTGGPPVGSATTVVELDGTVQTSTVQNVSSPFQLNQLAMLVDATNGFVVTGGPLQFTGAGATILNGAAALLDVSAPVIFAANTMIDPTANNPVGAEIRLGGPLTAAAGVTVTVGAPDSVAGAVVLLDGTSPGFLGTWAVTNGVATYTSAANALGRTAAVTLTGQTSGFLVGRAAASGFPDVGTGIQLGSVSGTGAFQVGTTLSASAAAVGFGDATFSLTSTGTLSAANAGSHFAKVGAGTFTDAGAQASFSGSVSVRDGLFNFSGSTAATGGFGSASTGPVAVYAGAELRETMTGTGTNGRIGNTQAITLNGGTLRMDASGLGTSAAGYSEVAGPLAVGAGQSTVRIDTAAGRGARFSFTSLAQAAATGTVFFQSGNLGTAALNTAGAGNVNFGTAPTLVGGIIPYAFAADTATGPPTTFVTYDGTNASVRALTTYAAAFGTPTDTVGLGAATTVSAATTANAVRLTAGGSLAVSAGLTLTSGAFLNTGGGDVTGTGTVDFTPAPAAYLTTTGPMTFSAPLSAVNFAKSGAGTLTLGGPVTLSAVAGNGVVAVNAGTLVVGAGASFTNANTFQVSRGATLDVTAAPLALGTGRTLTGGGPGSGAATVAGNVTLNAGGTVTPSALGGPDANRASPGTLTVTGNLALNGGATYTWYLSSGVTDGDNTVPATTGTLANFRSVYTAGELVVGGTLDLSGASSANKVNLKLTSLALSNTAGPVYDLKPTDTRSWVIAEAGSITGFSPDKFNLDTTVFSTPAGTPAFTVSQVGNALVLTAGGAPVPEPAAVLAAAAAALAAGRLVRRGRGPAARA